MILHPRNYLLLLAGACCLWTGCLQPRHDVADARLEAYPALQNLLLVTGRFYSGGQPDGDGAFAQLSELGVKTIVSVDGATPDVAAARRHGLDYVHIPIGYDGVAEEAGLSLARLVRDRGGPFYIHCHHGQHRAPVAAAIACLAAGDVDGSGALKILERAGTSREYAGLWRDVENYQVPAKDAELPALVEVATVESLAAAMAKIDRAYDNVKLCRKANWGTPYEHPDLNPAQEALLVKEGLRESARNLAGEYGDEFKRWLTEGEFLAQEFEDSLKADSAEDEISRKFQALQKSCRQCHDKHRN